MRTDENLMVQQALQEGLLLPWALVRSYSQVTLGSTPAAVDLEELLEARFFGNGTEIRLFRYDGTLHAARLREDPEDDILAERFALADARFGGAITVHHILDVGEDEQTYRAASLLAEWKEAET